ncbi:hypothetical protein EDC01DRAFT_235621 [Geopyxis carbonaria]|nr:hypothetical protein EDC01DRAFT_235621 [Geopyxis carbonaria]
MCLRLRRCGLKVQVYAEGVSITERVCLVLVDYTTRDSFDKAMATLNNQHGIRRIVVDESHLGLDSNVKRFRRCFNGLRKTASWGCQREYLTGTLSPSVEEAFVKWFLIPQAAVFREICHRWSIDFQVLHKVQKGTSVNLAAFRVQKDKNHIPLQPVQGGV